MKLVDNWKAILRRSWSVWCMGLIAVMSSASAILPLFVDHISHVTFALLTVIFAFFGIAARVIAQKELHVDAD